jgi:hypothetical protein
VVSSGNVGQWLFGWCWLHRTCLHLDSLLRSTKCPPVHSSIPWEGLVWDPIWVCYYDLILIASTAIASAKVIATVWSQEAATVSKSGATGNIDCGREERTIIIHVKRRVQPEAGGISNGTRIRLSTDATQKIEWSEMTLWLLKLCSEGYTYGFDRRSTLSGCPGSECHICRAILRECFFFAPCRYLYRKIFWWRLLYYEEDVVLTICPETTLKAKGGPPINAENLMIECEGCTIDAELTLSLVRMPEISSFAVSTLSVRASSLVFKMGAEHILWKLLRRGVHVQRKSSEPSGCQPTSIIINFYLSYWSGKATGDRFCIFYRYDPSGVRQD